MSAVGTLYLNCIFFLCFLPYACALVIIQTTEWNSSKLVALHFTGTLVLINSSLNPLVFCWRLREIRTAVLQTLSAVICRSEQS